jgi:peroxiredoxin
VEEPMITLAVASLFASLAVGEPAPDITLPIVREGAKETLALKEVLAKNKLTVVMFIATQCPVSNAYNARMADIAKEYMPKGVAFVGVNSNKQETMAEIAEHARQNRFGFAVVKDDKNVVADRYGARVTPEIFVIDATGVVRYHGRIDEKQDGKDIKSPDLKNALDALLAGKAPPAPETKAFGCSIKRV